jgi:hypothetical protein
VSELAWKLALLFALAGLGGGLGMYCVAALYRRRDPEFYRRPARPPITAAMEHDLLGRDNDATRDVLTGTPYVRGRPMYAIEAAPVAPSRSRS